MPIYEVTLRSTYQNQQCINRFNYISEGTPAAVTRAFGLWNAFVYQVADPPVGPPTEFYDEGVMYYIAQLSFSSVVFNDVTVLNVYDPLDFYASGFSFQANGLAGGEGASPALAYGFTSGLVRRDIRRGTKRFTGVTEAYTGQGGTLTSEGLTRMNALAAAMARQLPYEDEGNNLTFIPCIAGKQRYIPEGNPPDKPAYRYYQEEGNTPAQNEALQMQHIAVGINWTPSTTVRTQTSRQYGKGR